MSRRTRPIAPRHTKRGTVSRRSCIKSAFCATAASNWELSTARATNVVQYLLTQHKYPPKHIAAIGYGENKNLARGADEDLETWYSKNRRVVFVVKNPEKEASADEPPSSAAKDKSDH
jgi:hypothetical protein